MDAKDLLHAIGEIDEKYIAEAHAADHLENDAAAGTENITPNNIRRLRFRPWMVGGIAAALLLGFVSIRMLTRLNQAPESAQMTEIVAEESESAMEADEAAPEIAMEADEAEPEAAEGAGAGEPIDAEGAEEASRADKEKNAIGAANAEAASASEEAADASEEAADANTYSGVDGYATAGAVGESDLAIANPFSTFDGPEEAEKSAGFSFDVPEEAAGGKPSVYRVIPGKLYEIIFKGNDGNEVLRIRKAPGEVDISGNYENYSLGTTETIDGREVTMLGVGESIYQASWVQDDYTYALLIVDHPLSIDEVKEIVAAVK